MAAELFIRFIKKVQCWFDITNNSTQRAQTLPRPLQCRPLVCDNILYKMHIYVKESEKLILCEKLILEPHVDPDQL